MMQEKALARAKMLSLPHLVIVFVVALIVFGPEKLPELARNMGKVMAEFKRATGDIRSGFEQQLQELERETRMSDSPQRKPAPGNPAPSDSTSPVGALPPAGPDGTSKPAPGHVSDPGSDPAAESSETLPEKAIHGDTKPA
jgi:TatA/E family protein of Tat protein translocase